MAKSGPTRRARTGWASWPPKSTYDDPSGGLRNSFSRAEVGAGQQPGQKGLVEYGREVGAGPAEGVQHLPQALRLRGLRLDPLVEQPPADRRAAVTPVGQGGAEFRRSDEAFVVRQHGLETGALRAAVRPFLQVRRVHDAQVGDGPGVLHLEQEGEQGDERGLGGGQRGGLEGAPDAVQPQVRPADRAPGESGVVPGVVGEYPPFPVVESGESARGVRGLGPEARGPFAGGGRDERPGFGAFGQLPPRALEFGGGGRCGAAVAPVAARLLVPPLAGLLQQDVPLLGRGDEHARVPLPRQEGQRAPEGGEFLRPAGNAVALEPAFERLDRHVLRAPRLDLVGEPLRRG